MTKPKCNCTPRFLLNGTVSHAPTCPEHSEYKPEQTTFREETGRRPWGGPGSAKESK